VQHLVLGTAAPASHSSPASSTPFPHTGRTTPLVPNTTGGGGAIAEFGGVNALGFVSEGVLDRDFDEVPEIDKAGPEAESDPDGGMTDDAATEAGTEALTLLLATITLLFATTLEATTLLLTTTLEAATTPLLEATTPPLLEAATGALEEATAPLLEAITPLLLAGTPLLLLGTMLDAGTEALRVLVAENVELEHWWRVTRL